MKVKKIMTKQVAYCATHDSLAKAVGLMWENDCGAIPIVEDDKPVGILTDRDIAIAVATRNRTASDICVSELGRRCVVVCKIGDKPESALKTMSEHGVRRLPVVDEDGNMTGIITISDILRTARKDKKLLKKVVQALSLISKPNKKELDTCASG
jgi:CBS domain-containing protein